jgi:hypothetical protein
MFSTTQRGTSPTVREGSVTYSRSTIHGLGDAILRDKEANDVPGIATTATRF